MLTIFVLAYLVIGFGAATEAWKQAKVESRRLEMKNRGTAPEAAFDFARRVLCVIWAACDFLFWPRYIGALLTKNAWQVKPIDPAANDAQD